MIIQLKGADASANNLGQLNVPSEFDESTKTLLVNMSKYPMYSKEAICINQLIVDLKANGLWSKIQLFYVPWMAATVDELEYNLNGVPLSVDKTNLYFQDGNLYAYSIAPKMSNIMCSMPDIDIKNNFVAIPIASVNLNDHATDPRISMAIVRNSNDNLCVMCVSQHLVCGLGTAINFNNILSPLNQVRGGLINVSDSFTGVNPSDLASFTVNGLEPSLKGSLSAKTETKVNMISLSKHFGTSENPTLLWGDYFRPVYIFGNTVLSSSEVTTMVSILTKYSDNI